MINGQSGKEGGETRPPTITISPPNWKTLELWIKGTAPLVMHKFTCSPRHSPIHIDREYKPPKPLTEEEANRRLNNARHISLEGWDGIPASAFRQACVSACQLYGFHMSLAKLGIFVLEDGWDCDEGSPLVKIIGDKPKKLESMIRLPGTQKIADIGIRPKYENWGVKLRIRYDADRFSENDVTNLILVAGKRVGVGEGRPDPKNPNATGWGTFEVSSQEAVQKLERSVA